MIRPVNWEVYKRAAYEVLEDWSLAEDCVQDCIVVWLTMDKAQREAVHHYFAYMYTVVRRHALAMKRRRQWEETGEIPDQGLDSTVALDMLIAVDQTLDRLTESHATAVGLVRVEGLTQEEAGERMGVTQQTVSGWLLEFDQALEEVLSE